MPPRGISPFKNKICKVCTARYDCPLAGIVVSELILWDTLRPLTDAAKEAFESLKIKDVLRNYPCLKDMKDTVMKNARDSDFSYFIEIDNKFWKEVILEIEDAAK